MFFFFVDEQETIAKCENIGRGCLGSILCGVSSLFVKFCILLIPYRQNCVFVNCL